MLLQPYALVLKSKQSKLIVNLPNREAACTQFSLYGILVLNDISFSSILKHYQYSSCFNNLYVTYYKILINCLSTSAVIFIAFPVFIYLRLTDLFCSL